MTKVERKRSRQTAALGLLITAFFVANPGDWLAPVERALYDLRARECQFFSLPPTNQLVHLDIDDRALESVGKFPDNWPRGFQAQIIDEVNDAGAMALALDVTYQDSQPGEDSKFAASAARFGRVLVPVNLDPKPPPRPSPMQRMMRQALDKNMEITLDEMIELIRDSDAKVIPGDMEIESAFYAARKQAMFDAIDRQVIVGVDDLKVIQTQILPHHDSEIETPVYKLLVEQHERVKAFRILDRFARPVPRDIIPSILVHQVQPPVSVIGKSAGQIAFVDFILHDDRVLRDVPLWSEYRGKLYPQMGLAMACMALHVDPRDLRIESERTIISRPGNAEIVIPTRSEVSSSTGEIYGHYLDVPWFGRLNGWMTMYDYPDHQRSAQHVPMSAVTDIIQSRQQIIRNNLRADEAIKFFYATLYKLEPKLEPYIKAPPPPDDWTARESRIHELLDHQDSKNAIARELHETLAPIEDRQIRGQTLEKEEKELLLNYRQLHASLKVQPAKIKSHQDQRARLRARLADRTVIIGWTATSVIADFVPTSIDSKCPGVVVHGAVFNAIMTGDLWRRAPSWVAPMLTLIFGLIVTAAVSYTSPVNATFVSFGLGVGYALFNGLILFDYGNLIVALAPPLTTTGTVWSLCVAQRYLVERRERARIIARFQTYVDPELVSFVQDHPELASFTGATKELTVVFTDLQDFTKISEKLQERTVPLLNRYMSLMVPLIRSNHGYVNKFLGDGIMFFFGAPRQNVDHARNAITAVLQMQRAMIEFNQHLAAEGLPKVNMRVGITTGNMVVGDAGPPGISSDYTVLGDAVNLAARFESANKVTGTSILISERTTELLGGQFLIRPVGRLRVLGKTEFVMTYEPLASVESATQDQVKLAHATMRMVKAYFAAEFAKCIDEANFMEGSFGVNNLSTLYRDLCLGHINKPPEHFEGGISLADK